MKMQSWQGAVANILAQHKACCARVANDCSYLVKGMHYSNPMYYLPPLPLVYLSSS